MRDIAGYVIIDLVANLTGIRSPITLVMINHMASCSAGCGSLEDSRLSDEFLPLVQKPSRYIGNEINAVRKDTASVKLRIALAFPDVYEVGMSHLGLKILYSVVNARPDLYAERVFAPWPDMEDLMRQHQSPLVTLETGTPLSNLDIVGFSLQYELCATTVLQMLHLGGIPLRARDRGMADPLVIGGGPVAFNPMPLAPFFDAFVVGEGEKIILELADACIEWRKSGGTKEELLHSWKNLGGVFIPTLRQDGEVVSKRIVADLDNAAFPRAFVIPFSEIVHDRVGIEIARGCTRGCRFCQAGMLYRPVRERGPETILQLARENIAATGWEEIALLSLSSGDYSRIGHLIKRMAEETAPDMVALSLPSLRTDTFEAKMAEEIRKVRKTGFTLAPEAGTDRLRRIINKGNTEEDLEAAVSTAFDAGWKSLKLYFMVGLPFETDEDLDGIVNLVRKASKWAKGGKITASVSTFVPKSHTPFQWAGQISIEETLRRQQYIRRFFQKGRARVKFHDPKVSFLEGVLARGDIELANVIERAFQKGARLDGWDEHMKFDVWTEAFQAARIDPERYLAPRPVDAELPWHMVNSGVRTEYLVEEWEKAQSEAATSDCRFGDCGGCGVCDFDEIQPRLAFEETLSSQKSDAVPPVDSARRFRLRYGKTGLMRFLGHQDLIRLFHRAFRRAGLRLDYSKGFHPHPRLRFSPPLALGIESVAEYLDFDLAHCPHRVDEICQGLAQALPEGLKPLKLDEISLSDPSICGKIRQFNYQITALNSLSSDAIRAKVREFESSPAVELTRKRGGKTDTRDLKQWVERLDASDGRLEMSIAAGPSGSVHPLDALGAILGLGRDKIRSMKILKTSALFDIPSSHDQG